MTATFNPDLSDPISQVRQMIGDTVVGSAQVQDETITAYLANLDNDPRRVAIQLCYDLAMKWAGIADAELDDQEIKASHISANYLAAAKRLEGLILAPVAGVTYSGILVTGLGDCRGPDLGRVWPGCCE